MKNAVYARVILPKQDEDNAAAESKNPLLKFLTTKKRIIVFSPHLDDAVLSTGSLLGNLTEKGIKVEVITIFTSSTKLVSSLTQELLIQAQFENAKDYFLARKEEDKKALKELKVDKIKHLHYIDAAWRINVQNKSLYPKTTLGQVNAEDTHVKKDLSEKLRESVEKRKSTIAFAPLARGRHVDHQIVRDVVMNIFPNTIFYEDFPYSILYKNEDTFIKTKKLIPIEWKGEYIQKRDAILTYKTQRVSLFGKGSMALPFEKYYVSTNFIESFQDN